MWKLIIELISLSCQTSINNVIIYIYVSNLLGTNEQSAFVLNCLIDRIQVKYLSKVILLEISLICCLDIQLMKAFA